MESDQPWLAPFRISNWILKGISHNPSNQNTTMNTQKVEYNITILAIIVAALIVIGFFSACAPTYQWSVKKECLVDQHERCTDAEEIAATTNRDTVEARFLIERAQMAKRIELGKRPF